MSIVNGGGKPQQDPVAVQYGRTRREIEHAMRETIGHKAHLAGNVNPVALQIAVWRSLADALDRLSPPILNVNKVRFGEIDEPSVEKLKRIQAAGGGWALIRIGGAAPAATDAPDSA